MTTSIILSSFNTSSGNTKNNELRLKLPIPQQFTGKDVALGGLMIYYSWRNVTSAFGNNTVAYSLNGTTYNITIPDGYYSVDDLKGYIQQQMYKNGHYLVDDGGNYVYYLSLSTNAVYYAITLTVTPIPTTLPSGWTNPAGLSLNGAAPYLVINNSAFGSLIGYTTGTFPSAPVTGTAPVSLNGTITPVISPVSSVNVCCNLVNNYAFNSYPDVIYSFNSTVSYGQQIIINPQNLFFFPVVGNKFSEIVVTLKDQNNRDIQILDTNMTVTLILKDQQTQMTNTKQ